MTIAFQNWVGYSSFYPAQEKGFCKEEGIEFVFVDEQLDSARHDAFKQGMLDFEGGTIDLGGSQMRKALGKRWIRCLE